ncbi:hypothetical protein [Rufibacter soli]
MKRLYSKIAAVLAMGFLLGACEENAIPDRFTYATNGSQIKVYNHVEGSPLTNFYLGDQRVTALSPTTNNGLRGLAFGATYPSVYGYALVPSGSFNLAVRDTSTMEPASFDATCKALSWKPIASPYNLLAQKQVTLDNNTNYSVFLVGTPAVMGTAAPDCGKVITPANYDIVVTRDQLPELDFSKVYFRFMNTIANAPYNFDVVATRQARAATSTLPAQDEVKTVIARNIAFKEIGPYVEVPLGNYRVDFYKAGTYGTGAGEVKYLSYPSTSTSAITTLALGRVYTFFLRGTFSTPGKSTHIDYWRER